MTDNNNDRVDNTRQLAERVQAFEMQVDEQREAVRRLALTGKHLARAIELSTRAASGKPTP